MRVVVVGGGQLARMMSPVSQELGVNLCVLVEELGSSAQQVFLDTIVGGPDNIDHLRRLVYGLDGLQPERADVLTFEHEHVPQKVIQQIELEGFVVHPSASALLYAQNKLAMREKLAELNIPCPKWTKVTNIQDVIKFFDVTQSSQLVLKAPVGGYDGKGIQFISTASDLTVAKWLELHNELLVEVPVDFDCEVAVLIVRSSRGEIQSYEVVQTEQVDGVCRTVIAPAPELSEAEREQATQIAIDIATQLDVVGILAVEMFYIKGARAKASQFLVNELAMRPHNSGHWTISGAITSQFENHIRAVLGLKLGDTSRINNSEYTVMCNILGSTRRELSEALPTALARNSRARVNLYGKSIRLGRKLGHVNISGTNLTELIADASWICQLFEGKV